MYKSKKTVSIFGACISRDNFNSQFNTRYKDFFEVKDLQYQSTLMSLLSPPIRYKVEELYPLKDYDLRIAINELEKTFLEALVNIPPDILIIDFFADARFKTIATNTGYLTVNEWSMVKTNFYQKLKNSHEGFYPSMEEYKEYMSKLVKYIHTHLPNTKIILNMAIGVTYYTNQEGENVQFSIDFVKKINKRLNLLNNLFISIASPLILDAMTMCSKGNIAHYWGLGYMHYTVNFYNDFMMGLQIIIQDDLLSLCKKNLSMLKKTSLCIDEKEKIIKSIFFSYTNLSPTDKLTLNNWLKGRYSKILKFILLYQKSPHVRLAFAYSIFRWGIRDVSIQDINFTLFLIEPIVSKKIKVSSDTYAYAKFIEGTVFFHFYKESFFTKSSNTIFFKKASLSLTYASKAKSAYIQQRSFYFLTKLYTIHKHSTKILSF